MIEYTVLHKTTAKKQLKTITCDICNFVVNADDFLEVQEFHHIRFTGGYGSIFGDSDFVECDICQHCLFEMIKGKYRITDSY